MLVLHERICDMCAGVTWIYLLISLLVLPGCICDVCVGLTWMYLLSFI